MSNVQHFIALVYITSAILTSAVRKVFLLIPLIYILPNFFDNKVFSIFLAETMLILLPFVQL